MNAALHPLPPLKTARELFDEQSRSPEPDRLATGSPALDLLLDGGLAPGETVEIYGQRSSGRFSLVLTVLAEATRARPAALVDLGSGLDAETAAAAGIDFEHLLWARPRNLPETLHSAETLVKTGLTLVVVDLGLPPLPGGVHRLATSWQRLARAARAHRVALLLSSPFAISGIASDRVIEVFQPTPRWRGREPSSRILRRVASQLALRKCRAVRPGGPRDGDSEVLRLRAAGGFEDALWPAGPREPFAVGEVSGERAIA